MRGFIYIAGSFETVNRSKCGRGGAWIDNDPHFWTQPPTWGICRNDLRRKAEPGDYVFFVLPRQARHPQAIFAYLRIAEKVPHLVAFRRPELASKRMGRKEPNGNIIVDSLGAYNRFDGGIHRKIFNKVKDEYVIADRGASRLLTSREIALIAPGFLEILRRVIGGTGRRPIDFISRRGRELSVAQVASLLTWLEFSRKRAKFAKPMRGGSEEGESTFHPRAATRTGCLSH